MNIDVNGLKQSIFWYNTVKISHIHIYIGLILDKVLTWKKS
jgi:hypothetical protein